MKKIVLRVDGGRKRGFGHIIRCSRLAELLDEQELRCFFVCCGDDDAAGYLESMGFDLHLVKKNKALDAILKLEPDLVINDIRNSSLDYMRELNAAGVRTVNFDDCGEGQALADAVIDTNLKPSAGSNVDCRYYGVDYVALDPQFVHYHNVEKEIAEHARKIMILMGGSDPKELTHKVLGALSPVAVRYETTVVVGPGNKRFFDNFNGYDAEGIRVLTDVSCMGRLMYEADIGISSGGISMYEMVAVGTPNIVLCQARHEVRNARLLEEQGIVVNLGMGAGALESWIKDAVETLAGDRARRKMMSEQGKHLVDAKGMERIMAVIMGLLQESKCLAV